MFKLLRTVKSLSRTWIGIQSRGIADLNRPGPPPLVPTEQREFEELQRRAQRPAAPPSESIITGAHDLGTHPDAPTPIKPEFEGDVNPKTGEQGGPKREPVGRWGEDEGGDWSFKGRVSDF